MRTTKGTMAAPATWPPSMMPMAIPLLRSNQKPTWVTSGT